MAKYLAAQGAQHLVLVGRTGTFESIQDSFSEWENRIKIKVATVDVSKENELSQLFEEIKNTMPPLKGILHCAGVIQDGMLLQPNWSAFEKVMAPKIAGAWNLHCLTKDLSLDFFVLFSSASALLGAHGQGNYAAANAFMDSLARYRKTMGWPALSINWGLWADIGMAARLNKQAQTHLHSLGWEKIGLEQGLQILEQLLEQDFAQVGVIPIQWQKFAQQFIIGQEPPLISDLIQQEKNETKLKREIKTNEEEDKKEKKMEWMEEFKQKFPQLSPNKRQKMLIQQLQSEIVQVLPLESADLLDPDKSLFDYGLDSLMSLNLTNQFRMSLQSPIPTTLFFDYPTILDLSNYLLEEIFSEENMSSGETLSEGEVLDDLEVENITERKTQKEVGEEELDEMSQDELLSLLTEQLK